MTLGYLDYSRVGTEEDGVVCKEPRFVKSSTPLPKATFDTIDLSTKTKKGEQASWVLVAEIYGDIAFLDTTLGTYICELGIGMAWRLFFSNLIYTGEEKKNQRCYFA